MSLERKELYTTQVERRKHLKSRNAKRKYVKSMHLIQQVWRNKRPGKADDIQIKFCEIKLATDQANL